MMSELRQDRTTGDWVLIAPQRGKRLRHPWRASPTDHHAPRFDPACPFCPGNEAQLPAILAETPAVAGRGWQVRVVPNRYPVASPDKSITSLSQAPHQAIAAFGFHEVLIESPRHDEDLTSMSAAEIELVALSYWRRFCELTGRAGVESVVLFRNHGTAGGASLLHPHAQIVALGIQPPWLRSARDWKRQNYAKQPSCPMCEELELERHDGRRIVEEAEPFVALVPFAATVPFEVWLVPKQHQSSFTEIDEAGCRSLGMALQSVLRRLRTIHGDVPYNFVVDSACKRDQHEPSMHWRLRIAPDLVPWGGFELGTRILINPSSPEEDAAILRSAEPAEVTR